jgi:methionyl-tRNA formyltransferase
MKISILCTDPKHPVVPRLTQWSSQTGLRGHEVALCHRRSELLPADILFLVSCAELIPGSVRSAYQAVLVLHASDLPLGRGWSPHIWSILQGVSEITVSLLEAEDPVDTGRIWFKKKFQLEGHELLEEINKKLFDMELELMSQAVDEFQTVTPQAQSEDGVSYFRRRTPDDSRIDPHRTIADQFELMRVADPARYPNFFEFRGEKYFLTIRKADHVD